MPRAPKHPGKPRHDPLHQDIAADDVLAKYGSVSTPGRRKKPRLARPDDDNPSEAILDPKTSRRIFELARDQQDELGDAADADDDDDVLEDEYTRPRARDPEQDDEDDEDDEEAHGFSGSDEERELEIDAGDIQALDALHPPGAGARKTLADLIFAKLDAGQGPSPAAVIRAADERTYADDDGAPDPAAGLDPKVVEVYIKVGELLRSYRAGPLPKPLKIIPSLPAWARLLALTAPERWSPHAAHAATRIFISNMKPPQARVFLEGVLLPLVRADLEAPAGKRDARRLSPHLYEALKRALYKPAAFFKGVVFPLLDGGCSLKEAAIVASVLAKVKVPLLHSSAALIRLAAMPYSGPTSLFIRVLLDKKHALPYKVLDALVAHFVRLAHAHAPGALPVLWHQALLVLAQRYAAHLAPEQKDALREVLRLHVHVQIGPEIRRELGAVGARGEERAGEGEAMDMS
ncbi:Bystin-domain-containing protein [Gloeopeniophorella convolvens]|nr:Bystin-domain-containing protein [Gloeopeniophorella convolvens]